MSDRLPQELIAKILSRLPVKTLLRFRSVSKPWLSLIDGPDFIKMHLNHSLQTCSNRTLILGGMGLHSIDFDKLNRAVELDYPFKSSGTPDVLGSCNGLILMRVGDNIMFIWNPSTKKHLKVPLQQIQSPNDSVGYIYESYGFGYDTINDDYKVVKVIEFSEKSRNWIGSEVKVYSMKSNSWKRVKDFPYNLPFSRVCGVYLRGALHSLVRKNPGLDSLGDAFHSIFSRNKESESPKLILAFDIGREEYRLVPQPEYPLEVDFDLNVTVFGGYLCMTCSYRDHFDLWMMKDYGVKESWTKLLSLVPPVIGGYDRVTPLAFSKSGFEILLNHDDSKLLWYDQRRKIIKRKRVNGLPHPFYAEVCVGSLVPLNGSGGRDGVKKQQGQEKRKENKSRMKSIVVWFLIRWLTPSQFPCSILVHIGRKRFYRDGFLSEGFKLVL